MLQVPDGCSWPTGHPGVCDVHQPDQTRSHRSVLAPGPSAQALHPETDIHVYSRIHTERDLALENGAVWAGQRKANLLNDVI